MPQAAMLTSAYKRSNMPEGVMVNCFAEKVATKPSEPVALIARSGQTAFKTVGSAPIRMMFQKQGLFSDAAMVLARDTLYSLTSGGVTTAYTGTVSGDDLVEADGGLDADYNSVIRIATGSALFKAQSDTSNVVQEDFPTTGGAGATSVCFHKGYWLASEAGSDAVYYQIPAATTWNALQFASAEYAPDKVVALRSFGELVAILGESSTEMWRATGDAASPLEPYGGMSYPIGCRSRYSAVNCLGTLLWVTDTCLVVSTSGGEPKTISDYGISEQIRRTNAADIRASSFTKDGHLFYRLTLGTTATWEYDLSTGSWARVNSDGYDYARADLFASVGDRVISRDVLSNQIWEVDPDVGLDDTDTFTMEFMAVLEALDGPSALANVELHCQRGGAPLTGQGSAPLVWMQVSRDGGKTWGPKKYRSMGVTGDYEVRVRWFGPWLATPPDGLLLKFGISDPTVRRISGVWVNVP